MEYMPPERRHSVSGVLRTIGMNGAERGRTAEYIVECSLARLQKAQLVSSFWRTNRNLDRFHGIDFQALRFEDAELVPIQVKSSFSAMERHLETHPDVPCVKIEIGEDFDQIDRLLTNLIRSYVG